MKTFILIILMIFLICISVNGEMRDPFQPSAENLQIFVIPVKYVDANNLSKLLTAKDSNLIPLNGYIEINQQTNSLLVKTSKSQFIKIKNLINNIDIPAKQVLIDARIVSVDTDFTRELGTEFGTTKKDNTMNVSGFNMDLPAGRIDPGHFNIAIAKLGDGVLLDTELSALESEGHGKIISRPKLVTLNREPAYIESGESIPYQERTSEGNTNIAFKKAVLGLKVTPEIMSNKKIRLNINVNQDKVSLLNVNGVPAINTREIKTQVLVNDQQTIVLGGIYEETKNNVTVKIPFLGSIPLLGALFRSKNVQTQQKELLIFITPKILG